MVKQLLFSVLFCSILLTGCTQQEQEHIFIISYYDSEGNTYAYDQDNNTYEINGDNIKETYLANIPTKPALKYSPIHKAYNIKRNFVGNYSCNSTDMFAYVTDLIETRGYTIVSEKAIPSLNTLYLHGDTDIVMYITPNKTNMYCKTSDGNFIEPDTIMKIIKEN